MRNLLVLSATAVLLSLALVGCKKPAEPEVSAPPPPDSRLLTPVEPPPPPPSTVRPPVAPRDPGPGPASSGQYLVQKGDTLWSIAQSKLGAGKRWQEIVALNPGLTPEKLQAGMKIKLPEK